MFFILETIALSLIFILLISLIKNLKIKFLASILSSFIIVMEIISYYSTNSFIEQRFIIHFNIDSLSKLGTLFAKEIIFALLLLFILTFIFYYISKRVILNKIGYILLLSLFSATLFIKNGIFYELYTMSKQYSAQKVSFKEALKELNIPISKYVMQKDLKAQKGKNIIVISVESLEKGFLDKFKQLTPNLNRLKNSWTYFDKMPVIVGADWTAGSLYTHQTGVPAIFNGFGNDFFLHSKNAKIVGLGNIFKKAGYDYRYLMGGIDFAGVGDILKLYGYKTVSEKNSIGKYPIRSYGLDDLDLFKEAKLQVDDLLKNKNRPFALFISTINSHFPNGFYDKRMEKFIKRKDSSLEFCVASIDYLIGDFIKFLEEKNLLKNSAVFIFPDHTLMGHGSKVHEILNKTERGIYLITNIKKDNFSKKTEQTLYQIDIPKLIIEGSKIKTNAKFLTDFITNKDIKKYILNNREKIASLNYASINRDSFNSNITLFLKGNRIILKSKNIEKSINIDLNYDVVDFIFSPDMVLLKSGKLYKKHIFSPHGHDLDGKRLHILAIIKDNTISYGYFGNKHKIGICKSGKEIKFTKKEVETILNSNRLISDYKPERAEVLKKYLVKDIKPIYDLKLNYKDVKTKDCMLNKNSNNSIDFIVNGKDPLMILPKIEANTDEIVLTVSINSPNEKKLKIYYKYNPNKGYNEQNIITLNLKKGDNLFHIKMPKRFVKNRLRVDIDSNQGVYKFNKFLISDYEFFSFAIQ